jgi:nucleotide-binding universal stress UspA family protein
MRQILACTDGSAYAPALYRLTAWAALRLGATVHVVHLLEHHRERAGSADLSGNFGVDSGEALLNELVSVEEKQNRLAREQGKAILDEARRELAAAGVTDPVLEQRHGELVQSVAALEGKADLVVLGKRGEETKHDSPRLGSNLESIVRASIRPVLVASREFKPVTSFLLAHDGGATTDRAVDFAVDQPLLRGLPCHLVRAGAADAAAESSTRDAAEKLRRAGYEVTVEVSAGEPAGVISQCLSRQDIGLIVMGAYSHSRLRQLFVGSTTTEILRTSHVPVLMFR